MGPVMSSGCFMGAPSGWWIHAELRGPLAHVLEGLGVDGNAVGEPPFFLQQLGLAREKDLSLRPQVLHDRVDRGLERRAARESPGVDRSEERRVGKGCR